MDLIVHPPEGGAPDVISEESVEYRDDTDAEYESVEVNGVTSISVVHTE